jgi:hypothetical protein
MMEGLMKIFSFVTRISMILTLTVAAASVIDVAITGFYPEIIVLLLWMTFVILVDRVFGRIL